MRLMTHTREAVSMTIGLIDNPGPLADEYLSTAEKIATLPIESAQSVTMILDWRLRYNVPGAAFMNEVERFFATIGALIPRLQLDHVGLSVWNGIGSISKETDFMRITDKNWTEVEIPDKWTGLQEGVVGAQPLYYCLFKRGYSRNTQRVLVGMNASLFYNDALFETTNWITSAYNITVADWEFKEIIGSGFGGMSHTPDMSRFAWHRIDSSRKMIIAVWTCAVAASYWGVKHSDAFLSLCASALVGPLFGLSVRDCKERFSVCVALATYVRARRERRVAWQITGGQSGSNMGSALTSQELAKWPSVISTVSILHQSLKAANGTLRTGRALVGATGPRISVVASDKWESPLDANLKPQLNYAVTGKTCPHPICLVANPDGTYGTPCDGRWLVVTKDEHLDGVESDCKMRVCLVHGNEIAAQNILAKLEKVGVWAYIQGMDECLSCAYKRALRHGFQVIIDSPIKASTTLVQSSGDDLFHSSSMRLIRFSKSPILLEKGKPSRNGLIRLGFTLFIVLLLLPCVVSQANSTTTSIETLWRPAVVCTKFSQPAHVGYQWMSIASIVTAVFSLVEAVDSIQQSRKYVTRCGYLNIIFACSNTILAGLCGYLGDNGCSETRATGVLKEVLLVAINRLAFETIDILSILIAFVSPWFLAIWALDHRDWWSLLEPTRFTLLLGSMAYVWLWVETVRHKSMSAGIVGRDRPFLFGKLVLLVTSVYAFVASPSPQPSGTSQIIIQIVPSIVGMIPEGLFQRYLLA